MKETTGKIIITLTVLLCIIIVISFVAFSVYAIVEYGKKPITEVPTWLFWLLK